MKMVTVAACGILGLVGGLGAQTKEAEEHLTFEVASVKLNTSMGGSSSINRKAGGMLECTNVPLRMLITFAYNVRDYQLVNAPGWAGTERYDIFAKPPEGEGAAEPGGWSDPLVERLRQRTRALLAERFGLVLHPESREMSIYALVVAKGGAKLTPSTTEGGPQMSTNDRRVSCKKVTVQRFAEIILASRMGRNVIDKTGLTGEYDLQFDFVPDEGTPKEGVARTPSNDLSGPTFFEAMKEKLGLQLETTKGPEQFLIIDKVDRPSAN